MDVSVGGGRKTAPNQTMSTLKFNHQQKEEKPKKGRGWGEQLKRQKERFYKRATGNVLTERE